MSLRKILHASSVEYAMEAHDGISAIIAERAGFKVIWASGFSIATALGHRDCNEISWTNFLDQVGYMIDSTSVPILVDGDSGFGNFNNVRQLVKKLSRYGTAGVCIEDKVFPKTNSFLPYNQTLVSIDEFTGKIKAAKDSQLTEDFCVVARTEALIANQGLQEALTRAYAYRDAGADAIFIHSKLSTPVEIEEFCKNWDYKIPLIIAPTKYAPQSPGLYQDLKISLVIWANHLMRASIKAMQQVSEYMYQNKTSYSINPPLFSVDDIFELVNEEELKNAEKRYLK